MDGVRNATGTPGTAAQLKINELLHGGVDDGERCGGIARKRETHR